jgi:hypothetical protein
VNKDKVNFKIMMDWYSNYPAPTKEEAIEEVKREMKLEKYEEIIK